GPLGGAAAGPRNREPGLRGGSRAGGSPRPRPLLPRPCDDRGPVGYGHGPGGRRGGRRPGRAGLRPAGPAASGAAGPRSRPAVPPDLTAVGTSPRFGPGHIQGGSNPMKKLLSLAAILAFAAVAGAADKAKSEWTGYITDTHCASKGANKEHTAGCIEKCMKSGFKAQIRVETAIKEPDLEDFG